MKRISVIILSVFLGVVLTLSGCTETEYVTVTDTVVVTETATLTTSEGGQYSQVVIDAIVLYATNVLEESGFSKTKMLVILKNGGDSIDLISYPLVHSKAVEIVQSIIDEIAPGLPLNVMVGTLVTSLV